MRLSFLLIILFSGFQSLFSQDYVWWNELHNWDGVTSWREYIIYSPSYMGPNALPVPEFNTGRFSDNFEYELGSTYHSSVGDQTANLFTKLNLALAPGIAGVSVSYVPYEIYSMNTETRDVRRARDFEPSGDSFGDVYVTTYVQVLKDKEQLPDIMISINLKTSSGTNLGNARHTDAPGYYFDLSLGKDIETKRASLKYWRPYGMGGFYSYQTNRDDYVQNDAILYAAGFVLGFKKFHLDAGLGGYYGYFGNGDQPLVYRMEIKSALESQLNYKLRFQTGLNDFQYTSIGFSAVLSFKRPRWMVSELGD